jgi:hypothetical protein
LHFVGYFRFKNVYPSLHSPQKNCLFSSSLQFLHKSFSPFLQEALELVLFSPNVKLSSVITIFKLFKLKNISLEIMLLFDLKPLRSNTARFLQFLNVEFNVFNLVVLKEDKFNSVKISQFSKALSIVSISEKLQFVKSTFSKEVQFKKVDSILLILFEIKLIKFTSTKFVQFKNILDIDSKSLSIIISIVIFLLSDEL